MQSVQGQMTTALQTSQGWLGEHTAQLPDDLKVGTREKFDEAIASLEEHVANQSGGTVKVATSTKQLGKLRKELLQLHMTPISRTARTIPEVAGLEELRMPKVRATYQQIIAAAEGMIQGAGPHADKFVAAGLSNDFITQLENAAGELRSTLVNRELRIGDKKAATASLKRALTTGRTLLFALDARVKRAFKDDHTMLASWARAKTTHNVRSPAASSVVTQAPEPTAVSTTA